MCVHAGMCGYMHVCIHGWVCICLTVCAYVCVCVCVCVCACIYRVSINMMPLAGCMSPSGESRLSAFDYTQSSPKPL